MNPDVDAFGAFGLIASEGFSFEMLETAEYETESENRTIKAIKNAKFMLHAGFHNGS